MQRLRGLMTLALAFGVVVVMLAGQTPARTVALGTLLDLHLQTALSAKASKLEQPFDAKILENYPAQGPVLIPAGAMVRGFISSVRPTAGLDHQSQLTLSFDELKVGDQALRLRASVVAVLAVKRSADLNRLGTTPVVGASMDISPVPMVGVMVGAGGSILSTNGDNITLPIGCVLRIRLDRAIEIPSEK